MFNLKKCILRLFSNNNKNNNKINLIKSLEPDKNIQKLLISTPSNIKGIYNFEDKLNISISFPSIKDQIGFQTGFQENPYSRNYYIVTFKYEHPRNSSETINLISDLDEQGELFCICLSILYGKRIDFHGAIQNDGTYFTPFLSNIVPILNYKYSYNNYNVRKDLEIELNLNKVSLISKMLFDETIDNKIYDRIIAAGSFYLSALKMFEVEPEIAYLNLVTCGEILSNYISKKTEKEFNVDNKELSITKRYTVMINYLLNDNFFKNTESLDKLTSFTKDNIEGRIKASYDLRSKYVHSGIKFGRYIISNTNLLNEIAINKWNLPNKKLKNALFLAPTFTGLERIMRYSLLRFIHLYAFPIDNKLN